MRIAQVHSDWRRALGGAPLAVYGSFRRVVNAELAPSTDEAPVQLWIGARSCPFGPGALILDGEELPPELHRARWMALSVAGGAAELRLWEGEGPSGRAARVALGEMPPLRSARLADGGPVDAEALVAGAAWGAELLARQGAPASPFASGGGVSEAAPSTWGSASPLALRLTTGGEDLCRALAAFGRVEGAAVPTAKAALADAGEGLVRVWSGLVGLGPGLTPSADDFAVGALAVWRLAERPAPRALSAVADAVEAVAPRTTRVSQLYLQAAARGEFSDTVAAVARALVGSSGPGAASQAVAALLAHGATSGTDTFAGMIAMARALVRHGG